MLLQFSIRMNFESRTIEMSVLRKVEFSPEDLSIISDRNLLIDFIIIYFLIRSKESEMFKQIFQKSHPTFFKVNQNPLKDLKRHLL